MMSEYQFVPPLVVLILKTVIAASSFCEQSDMQKIMKKDFG